MNEPLDRSPTNTPPWVRTDNWLPVYGPLVGGKVAEPLPSAPGAGLGRGPALAPAPAPSRVLYGAGASFLRFPTPTSSARLLCSANPNRIGLVFVSSSGGTQEIVTDQGSFVGGTGIQWTGAGTQLRMWRASHGNVVAGNIYCVSTLSFLWAVLEVLSRPLDPDPSNPLGVKMPSPGGSQVKNITLTTTAQLLMGANANRYAIIWGSPPSTGAWLTNDNSAANLVGLNIAVGNTPWSMTYAQYGDIVRNQWYGAASAATTAFGWVEVFNA